MIRLAFKNLKNSFWGNRSVYMLLLASQMVGVMIIFFIYGIYTAYSASMQEIDVDSMQLYAEFVSDVECPLDEFRSIVPKLYEPFEKTVDYTFLGLSDSEGMLSTYWEYRQGDYHMASSLVGNNSIEEGGRDITDSEYVRGERVVFGSNKEVGESVYINGVEFRVVGRNEDEHLNDVLQVPVSSAPGDTDLFVLYINFNRLPKYSEYEHFRDTLKEVYGERVSICEFTVKDAEELISIRSIIVISVAIGVLVALDTVLIYSYIISRRRKQMAISSIVGARGWQRFAINEIEIMFVSLVVAIISYFIYRFGLEETVVKLSEASVELYSKKVYGMLIGFYLVSVFVITYIVIFINSRKNLVKMLRGSKNV